MIRVLVALLTAAVVAGIALPGETAAHTPTGLTLAGDGSARQNRMPFSENEASMFLTQGWNSPPGLGSHQGQYATDWAKAGNASFTVWAATEGDATCTQSGTGWGTYIDVVRSGGLIAERYAHLALLCPFSGTRHVEQGDLLAWSSDTGSPGVVHLHYEVFAYGQSTNHCLSQFCNFDDVYIHRNPEHHHHPAVADNAGPGVNNEGNLTAWGKIQTAYTSLGHYLCPPSNAWVCFGSSRIFVAGDTRDANRACYGASNDCGWHQDFQRLSDSMWNDLNWPEACPNITQAYWIPNQFFIAYVANNWLGQARSPVFFDPGYGYVQWFRHGYILSATFGGTPAVIGGGSFPTCQ